MHLSSHMRLSRTELLCHLSSISVFQSELCFGFATKDKEPCQDYSLERSYNLFLQHGRAVPPEFGWGFVQLL